MRAEDRARVLGLQVALDHRLEQVADRRQDGDAQPHDSASTPGQPVLVEPGEPEAERAADEPEGEALEGLVRRERRREPVAAEQPPAGVGGRVGDERRDEDVDEQRRAVVRELAQQDGVGERDPDPDDPEDRERDRDRDPVAIGPQRRRRRRSPGRVARSAIIIWYWLP